MLQLIPASIVSAFMKAEWETHPIMLAMAIAKHIRWYMFDDICLFESFVADLSIVTISNILNSEDIHAIICGAIDGLILFIWRVGLFYGN